MYENNKIVTTTVQNQNTGIIKWDTKYLKIKRKHIMGRFLCICSQLRHYPLVCGIAYKLQTKNPRYT